MPNQRSTHRGKKLEVYPAFRKAAFIDYLKRNKETVYRCGNTDYCVGTKFLRSLGNHDHVVGVDRIYDYMGFLPSYRTPAWFQRLLLNKVDPDQFISGKAILALLTPVKRLKVHHM